jgi:hypothetical protein
LQCMFRTISKNTSLTRIEQHLLHPLIRNQPLLRTPALRPRPPLRPRNLTTKNSTIMSWTRSTRTNRTATSTTSTASQRSSRALTWLLRRRR